MAGIKKHVKTDPTESARLRGERDEELAQAEAVRERREAEKWHLHDSIIFENFYAEKLAELTTDLPPLAVAIIEDRMDKVQTAILARESDRFPVLELTEGALRAHFLKLAPEVFLGA